MAFDQFKFQYNPPPTVPAAPPAPAAPRAVSLVTGASDALRETSSAGQLIARLSGLLDTNQYLQQVLLARSTGLGIELDPSRDPETARAFTTLYPNLPVPSSMTVPVYNRMLDAELAGLEIESGLGPNSPYEVNPHQMAAVSEINQAIENGLSSSAQFQYQLPLLLRQLKGDAVVFNNISAHLKLYPVMAAPSAPTVASSNPNRLSIRGQDVSDPLSTALNAEFDAFDRGYASIYQLSAGIGVVAQDVNNVLGAYFFEPAVNLIRMIGTFQSLLGFVHTPRLKAIVNGLSGFVFVRLLAEASGMGFMADRFIQTAIQPLRQMTSGIGGLLNQVAAISAQAQAEANGIKSTFNAVTGALKGISLAYDCGLPHNAALPRPPSPPAIKDITPGARAMLAHLDLAINTASLKTDMLNESFQKLLSRRSADLNAQLDVMCSTQAVNTMTQLAQAVMSFNSSQPAVGSSGTLSSTAAVGRILSGMHSSTGTSFVVTNGKVQAVPPSVPPIPSKVQPVLVKGGLNLIVASPTSGASI